LPRQALRNGLKAVKDRYQRRADVPASVEVLAEP
jgi:hypothetical protein